MCVFNIMWQQHWQKDGGLLTSYWVLMGVTCWPHLPSILLTRHKPFVASMTSQSHFESLSFIHHFLQFLISTFSRFCCFVGCLWDRRVFCNGQEGFVPPSSSPHIHGREEEKDALLSSPGITTSPSLHHSFTANSLHVAWEEVRHLRYLHYISGDGDYYSVWVQITGRTICTHIFHREAATGRCCNQAAS